MESMGPLEGSSFIHPKPNPKCTHLIFVAKDFGSTQAENKNVNATCRTLRNAYLGRVVNRYHAYLTSPSN